MIDEFCESRLRREEVGSSQFYNILQCKKIVKNICTAPCKVLRDHCRIPTGTVVGPSPENRFRVSRKSREGCVLCAFPWALYVSWPSRCGTHKKKTARSSACVWE